MTLVETFELVRPSIVALGSLMVPTKGSAPPAFPRIEGTGFVVDRRGIVVTNRHVAEKLENLPSHPKTGASVAFAMLPTPVFRVDDGWIGGILFRPIKGFVILNSFSSEKEYYGEPLPDIAFVQVDICETPALELATELNTLAIGMSIATAGFALGEDALAMYGKVNQITPLLRHGIVSSLFPYPCPFPHGFTVDILTQGGESGSPVFLPDSPSVVGLLYEGFDEAKITTVIPSHIVSQALGSCLEVTKFDFSGSPTYEELVNKEKRKQGLTWERLESRDEGKK